MIRRWLIFLVVLLALVLTACGGDDSSDENSGEENDNTAVSSTPDDSEDNTENNDGRSPPISRTLPPTREVTPTFTLVPPSETPTLGPSNTPDDVAAAVCDAFAPDTVSNQDSESIQIGDEVTIYWHGPSANNITYVIELIDSDGLAIFAEETIELEYTFEPSYFEGPIQRAFYWRVIANQNGVPLDACGSLGGEIFVASAMGFTPSPSPTLAGDTSTQ